MFKKILIANRGEIALRIQRACRELGIKTVVVYSEADRDAKYVKLADEAVCIGPAASAQSYLNMPAIIATAEVTDAEAIHPGYGFLSENADFAERVERSGFTFIGPTLRIDPADGRQGLGQAGHDQGGRARACPAPTARCRTSRPRSSRRRAQIGYPVIIKASGGGGGRGMRVVHTEAALLSARRDDARRSRQRRSATRRSTWRSSSRTRATSRSRFSPTSTRTRSSSASATARCSAATRRSSRRRRRRASRAALIERIGERCAAACRKIGYRGAGTFEFLYENGEFYFIEMNTRVQVEHPVTELVTGIDIVQMQIRIAAGEKLPFAQRDVPCRGHAIECRVNAEDPYKFTPSPGRITMWHPPGGPGVRVDSHAYTNYVVPPNYDSMIGKIIVHGDTRAAGARAACARRSRKPSSRASRPTSRCTAI